MTFRDAFRALFPWCQPRPTGPLPDAERDSRRTATPEQALRDRVRGSGGQ